MPKPISININVTKIDKDRLYKGKKGTYLDAVLIPTPDDQYGNDYMIVQSVDKEERESGVRGEILGNAKHFGSDRESSTGGSQAGGGAANQEEDDTIPF